MVAAVSNAGGVGTFPVMNYWNAKELDAALGDLEKMTSRPYGVNLIVHDSMKKKNEAYLEVCKAHSVPLYITSLGTPGRVIELAHSYGAHVWCDVVNKDYARKVAGLGADAVVAVTDGAGGHAGKMTSSVLVPELKSSLDIPVLQAGGIADAQSFHSALERGADAAYMGTRFIASDECSASPEYKQAIVDAAADDIVMTETLSGSPCAVINTEYVQRTGTEVNWLLKRMMKSRWLCVRNVARAFIYTRGMRTLKNSFGHNPYEEVFVAGRTVGLIHSVEPAQKIIEDIVDGYTALRDNAQ